jgi:uncharacterized protein
LIHPGTRLAHINDTIGVGVVASQPLPKGTVIWMRDAIDQVFSPAQVASLTAPLRHLVELYSYRDFDGSLVLPWDHGRLVNHSCEASCTTIGNHFEIANRDLAPGDEITCEYGHGFFTVPFACRCGAPTCRGDSLLPAGPAVWARWDAQSADVWACAYTVEKPVLAVITPGQPGAWLLEALRDRRPITLPAWANGATAADWVRDPATG